MMTLRRSDDIVVTIEDISPGEVPTYNKIAVERIAATMGFAVDFCTINIPFRRPREHFVYQMWPFFLVSGLLIEKNTAITEVWYGGEKAGAEPPFTEGADTTLLDPRKKYTQLMAGWNLLFPHAPLVFPLESLTKQEQWALIPAHVKPLVRTCLQNVTHGRDINCGICRKCAELKLLPGSCFAL